LSGKLRKNEIIEWINSNEDRLIEIAHKIWEYAEPSLQEFKSSQLIMDELEKEEFTLECGVAGMPTAFVATYESGKPVVGILGEYDALPGLSQKPIPRKEPLKEGAPGHGCGHNLLGTGAAGAAMAAKHVMEKHGLQGTIKYFGCPAEETLVGKVFMVKAGFFDDVDAALAWHPWCANTTWMASFLAMNSVKFRFHGVSAHAATSPEAGRSALDAVELMNVGVNYLREHVAQEARIHYVITSGGQAPNIVPDFAEVWYFVRAPRRTDVEAIYSRILDIAKGAALMTGTKEEIEFITGCWEVLPNKTLSNILYKNLEDVGPPIFSEEEKQFAREIAKTFPKGQKETVLRSLSVPEFEKAMKSDLIEYVSPPEDVGKVIPGSTDLGDVSVKVPTAQCNVCTFVPGSAPHSWQVVATSGMGIGHKGMLVASKALALTAIDLLVKPDELRKAKDELRGSAPTRSRRKLE
jgi:aminobenzoyl-glutamate utilization protein B